MKYEFKVLNTREVKAILAELKEHFGMEDKMEEAFIEGGDGKIYLISRKFGEIDQSKLRINNLGLYFCKREKGGLRPTIEGSQIIHATTNVFEMNEEQMDEWIHGNDLRVGKQGLQGMVILKYKNDFYGCGAYKEERILNFTPKERRLVAGAKAVMEEIQ
ncbi:MAG: hypothetical protein PHO02_03635 [Candidatus Nanoarchaeia archaeon]|nr:hypothetical protein [Candidatus Nanoarchaeia archaeon]